MCSVILATPSDVSYDTPKAFEPSDPENHAGSDDEIMEIDVPEGSSPDPRMSPQCVVTREPLSPGTSSELTSPLVLRNLLPDNDGNLDVNVERMQPDLCTDEPAERFLPKNEEDCSQQPTHALTTPQSGPLSVGAEPISFQRLYKNPASGTSWGKMSVDSWSRDK